MIRTILHFRARLLLARASFWLLGSCWHDRASAAALKRAGRWMAAARAAAERLESKRPAPDGDLLFGSRAIAAHLGVPKATARHLIRVRAIPWFEFAGVACARRSTLAAHFQALEAPNRS